MTKNALKDVVVPPPPPPPDFARAKDARARGRRIATQRTKCAGGLLRAAAAQLDLAEPLCTPGLAYGLLLLLSLKRDDTAFTDAVLKLGDDWLADGTAKTQPKRRKESSATSQTNKPTEDVGEMHPAAAQSGEPSQTPIKPETDDAADPVRDDASPPTPDIDLSISPEPSTPSDARTPDVDDNDRPEKDFAAPPHVETFSAADAQTTPFDVASDSSAPDVTPAPDSINRKTPQRGAMQERRPKFFKLATPAAPSSESTREESEEPRESDRDRNAPDAHEPSPASMS